MKRVLGGVVCVCIGCGGSSPPPAVEPSQPEPPSVQAAAPAPKTSPEYQPPDVCKTDAKACLDALEADCTGKNFDACGYLGGVFEDAEAFDQAAPMYKAACDGGIQGYCNNLGRLYKYGRGVEQSYAKAAELFDRACTAKDMLSCNNLGVLYENALGQPRDYARAKELYTMACEGSEMRGCYNLGVLYNDGHGVPVDPAKALLWFDRACTGGMSEGCDAKQQVGK